MTARLSLGYVPDAAKERGTVTDQLSNDSALGRTIVSSDELQTRIQALGKEITADYAEHPPLLIGVLKG